MPPNSMLEPTRLIASRTKGGLGLAGNVPARLLLHTRLAAQHRPSGSIKRKNMKRNECIPYKRKSLYLILTTPMIVMYVAITSFLWQISILACSIYVSLFVFVAFFMSYVCVYWECPYVGRFAPCVGGFCLPSSQIARLFKNARRSETRYHIFLNLAYVSFFGIILFPAPFLYVQDGVYLLGYIGIVIVYWVLFTLYICPVCGTRHICPGGQMSAKIKEKFEKNDEKDKHRDHHL